jgi:ubiquinone/menaquinone biosynthesis C-methylase UbiE
MRNGSHRPLAVPAGAGIGGKVHAEISLVLIANFPVSMTNSTKPPNIANRYDEDTARHYSAVHRSSWSRRVTSWREIGLARRALALAGNPESVLDMPCGTGRFWPMLARTSARRLLAGDNSPAMLAAAVAGAAPATRARFEVSPMDAFALPLADAAVDHVLCMRLLHHFAAPADRLRILREIHRVARSGATISLWVDGNLQARRRGRQEARRDPAFPPNRIIVARAVIEAELAEAGFRIRKRLDMLRWIGKRRLYVLDKA